MSDVTCLQIDAFADRPFVGNPAAVCLLHESRSEHWMQAIATEMNLSETAFVRPLDDDYELRWFTPTIEVDLCGHATLAAAHALWSEGMLEHDEEIRFHTRTGLLSCGLNGDLIELDFPATPVEPCDSPPKLCEALGIQPLLSGRSIFDALVMVETEQALRALRPDFRLLEEIPVRGVIVTSPADEPQFDFVSRFFAPAVGVNEDPVTGSAHCALAPFWAERLGKTEMLAYQASVRGGIVRVRVAGDRVILGGHAVTVLKGLLRTPG